MTATEATPDRPRKSSARVRKIRHDENTRAKIQAALIINRLTDCLMGRVELTPAQVTCGKTLLAKVLPDLQNTTLAGDADNPLGVVFQTVYEQPPPRRP